MRSPVRLGVDATARLFLHRQPIQKRVFPRKKPRHRDSCADPGPPPSRSRAPRLGEEAFEYGQITLGGSKDDTEWRILEAIAGQGADGCDCSMSVSQGLL
ncbi:hypothetical protein KM043_010233 [Ampulex compressa]|nr:hypothetical protein KM043_010233 [Ampulex compressa]